MVRGAPRPARVDGAPRSPSSFVNIMKKLILFVVSFFMACTSFASFPPGTPTGLQFSWPTGGGVSVANWKNDAPAACVDGIGKPHFGQTVSASSAYPSAPWRCSVDYVSGGVAIVNLLTQPAPNTCPVNSTLGGGVCTCNAGYDQSGSSCVPHTNACTAKAGKPGITNWTFGYSRTPDASDFNMVGGVNKVPPNQQVCDGGCVVELGEGKNAWQSQVPTSQGLYRWSLDLVSIPTGAECTAGAADAPADKTTPNPVCPGYVGEINGVKGCYGTASNPVNVVQADRPSTGAQPGNPAAGEKPATGEGSGSTGAGRTPDAGTGGADGGPASSAVNAKGNGTIDKPPTDKEQQACGAPGQPKCGIDETGTPTGKGALPTTDFEAKLQERQDALTTVTSASGKDTTWGVLPQWTQSGACSPWHMFTLPVFLGSFSVDIDLCPVKPFADGIANFIWVSLAFFGITAMVFSTMTSKAS